MALNVGFPVVSDASCIYLVDPFTVEVHLPAQGRDKAADDAAILEMAVSLHVHGQRRAAVCINENGHLRLAHGLIRTLAARLIRSGFSYKSPETGQVVRVKDGRFTLKVVIAS